MLPNMREPCHKMKARTLFVTTVLSIALASAYIGCDSRQNPFMNPDNVEVGVTAEVPGDSVCHVGDTLEIQIVICLPHLVDGVQMSIGSSSTILDTPYADTTVVLFIPDSSGSLTVSIEVIKTGGAMDCAEVTVVVLEPTVPPSIEIHPQDVAVTVGRTASFYITSSGTAPGYQWGMKVGSVWADIPGATAAVYVMDSVSLSDSGIAYRCVVSNSAGSDTSAVAVLTVFREAIAPAIADGPEDQAVTEGQAATFTVVVEGTDVTYQWQKDGESIVEATSSTYTTPATSTDDGGAVYRCIVSNSLGSDTSETAVLSVMPQAIAPSITSHPQSQSVTVGDSVTFTVVAEGVDVEYQWQVKVGSNWLPIIDAVSSSYTIVMATFLDNGMDCRCVVRNAAGTATSNVAVLTVRPPPGMKLISAAGKTYQMGCSVGDDACDTYEGPAHMVSFTYDFVIDSTEVTQKSYTDLMSAAYRAHTSPDWGSHGSGDDHPVYYVNWYDAALYCNARTVAAGYADTVYGYTSITGTPGNDCVLEGLSIDTSARGFRLPTEAEWEYACRAGSNSRYYWGETVDAMTVGSYAWYDGNNTPNGTKQVAQKMPNNYGLYDMAGNVWEWCNDWYYSYSDEAQTDPFGPDSGWDRRIKRGGSWYFGTTGLRSSHRYHDLPDGANPTVGFRTVLPVE